MSVEHFKSNLEWTLDELLNFIKEAHLLTYAANGQQTIKTQTQSFLPGHKDFIYEKGDWTYRDSYAGFYWPPGKEVIFYKNKPCWCMSYQGMVVDKVSKEKADGVYQFLKKALQQASDSKPFRGPDSYQEGRLEYLFEMNGDAYYFTGREEIKENGRVIFFQDIMASAII